MNVDPTEPETFDEYPEESAAGAPAVDPLGESSEADSAEQAREVLPVRDGLPAEAGSVEADPADAAEQAREVDPGDDDYR